MPDAHRLLEEAEAGYASPADFARVASYGLWEPAPHLLLLNYYLLLLYAGSIQRLMVFMPPRHGKSEFCSRWFPAWWLGRRPSSRVLLASYEADFASSWGASARNALEEHGRSVFGVEVAQDRRAMNRWTVLQHAGGMQTAGVGGPLTGKGGELLIVDDPVKNDEQANSPVYREKAWEWWRATFRTRGNPGFRMLHIQTRWHEDDLGGRILANSAPGDWTVLNLPAIAEEPERLEMGWSREPGEPLWPARYNVPALESIRHDVGGYWWSALYQQRPAPAEGGTFQRSWFRYWQGLGGNLMRLGERTVDLNACYRFLTVDLAASTKERADYTVVSAWAMDGQRNLVLLDRVRSRSEGPDQPGLVRGMYERWRPSQVHVEAVAYQLTLVQTLRRQGLPIVEVRPDRDKVSRALVAAARLEGGSVWWPQAADWLSEWEAEVLAFPTGAHDDQVDTLSQAAEVVAQRAGGRQLASW